MVNDKNVVQFPYEMQAIRGEEMPKGISCIEQEVYQAFRMLYAQYRMKIVDRETASREKKEILREYVAGVPELTVVVGVTATAILNAIHMVVVVNHFVKKGCSNLFDGSGQCSGADVDLVRSAQLGNPGVFSQGEVAVGFGGRLDGDGGS